MKISIGEEISLATVKSNCYDFDYNISDNFYDFDYFISAKLPGESLTMVQLIILNANFERIYLLFTEWSLNLQPFCLVKVKVLEA